ncbi:hypothetical protein [Arachidicoccus terrestris]|uniref:hypothetical protein n=1 Tax=Arachidicoccus terrestris TaxID=2875539 RepID=UPI001CC69D35|nr:hypothetical protein [Arachidicoccus terrestris]UAY55141.1 hypothetical protein K9M52_17230 [Arachidicoccus terrestris]
METRKNILPGVRPINDNKRIKQLATIVHNTGRWMDVLYHECNGLFGNMNWVSRIMQEEAEDQDVLVKETFAELNRLTQKNIYTLKTIHSYIDIMNTVANTNVSSGDLVILSEAILLTSVPGMKQLDIQCSGLPLKVTRTFAKVVAFLLNKVLEISEQAGFDGGSIKIVFNDQKRAYLCICISSSALFWHHELWEQNLLSPLHELPSDPSKWSGQIFYEMLALVEGKVVSGCTQQRNFTTVGRKPRLATELIQREISPQHLEFLIPFGLGRA